MRVAAASVTSSGKLANAVLTSSMSDDGRWVTFDSSSAGVTPGSPTAEGRVYLRDMVSGKTRLVSADSQDRPATGFHAFGKVSGDGRWVVWRADGSSLVPTRLREVSHLAFKDLRTGQVQVVAGPPGLGPAAGLTSEPTPRGISADGRWIAAEVDLHSADYLQRYTQLALYDRVTSRWTRFGGQGVNRYVQDISDDGNVVAFTRGDRRGASSSRPYLFDRQAGMTTEIPSGPAGSRSWAQGSTLSGDGKLVFNHWNRDPYGYDAHVVIHRRSDLAVIGQMREPGLYGVSGADRTGRYVAINMSRSRSTPGFGDLADAYRLDRATGQRLQLSVNNQGEPAGGFTGAQEISSDGNAVLLHSLATNLAPGDVAHPPDSTEGYDAFVARIGPK